MAPDIATCRYIYGTATCSEFNYCSGNGNCTDGLCACNPGYLGLDCANFVSCQYWDVANASWSSYGVRTVYEDGAVFCETTHLTDFGGIVSFPTSPDELLAALEAALHFNTFTMDEMFDLLSNFNFGDNLTIMIFIITLYSLNFLTLFWLGVFRHYRKRKNRRRENRMYEREALMLEVKLMEERKKQWAVAPEKSGSGNGTPRLGSMSAMGSILGRRGSAAVPTALAKPGERSPLRSFVRKSKAASSEAEPGQRAAAPQEESAEATVGQLELKV